MALIGLLTMSDGRDFVARDVAGFVEEATRTLAGALRDQGHEVIAARDTIWTNELATTEARWVAGHQPDLTIFHYPVWAFPHFTMASADSTPGPLLLVGHHRSAVPGHGRHAGRRRCARPDRPLHSRVWGDVTAPETMHRLLSEVRAARRLRGACGAPPSVASAAGRWGCTPPSPTPTSGCGQFGVDVEEIDQWEIVRRSANVEPVAGDGRPGVAGEERHRPLRRQAADARAARAPDPLLLRDAGADRGVESRLLRHQGPAGADDPLRHHGHRRGVPERPL